MPKPKLNRTREHRIDEEIVVDAYTSDERALIWYYYLKDKLELPFRVRCVTARTMSPLKAGERGDVFAMAKGDDCMDEMLVMISFAGRRLGVLLTQLDVLKAKSGTREAVEDWHYWKSRDYEF